MIRLHCTKKLLAKLPLRQDGRIHNQCSSIYAANDDLEVSPLSGWHGHLILLQRRQCVLLVHDATRFPVFIPALKKADFAELDYCFNDAFMNTLLKLGADEALFDRANAALGPLVCDNHCDRSVQGTLNQMAQDLRYTFANGNIDVAEITGYRIGAWLAHRPCTVKGIKGCIWPDKAMHELLLSY